jgi:DNA-binding response OmpR family regulator
MNHDADDPESAAEERRPTVLLIEGDEHWRFCTAALLVQEGYSVVTASNGDNALAILRRPFSPIDVVVLGLDLPDIHGVELCEYLHRLYPDLPVIACTGRVTGPEASRLLELGVQRYLPKPVSPDEILSSVEAALP